MSYRVIGGRVPFTRIISRVEPSPKHLKNGMIPGKEEPRDQVFGYLFVQFGFEFLDSLRQNLNGRY